MPRLHSMSRNDRPINLRRPLFLPMASRLHNTLPLFPYLVYLLKCLSFRQKLSGSVSLETFEALDRTLPWRFGLISLFVPFFYCCLWPLFFSTSITPSLQCAYIIGCLSDSNLDNLEEMDCALPGNRNSMAPELLLKLCDNIT